MAKTTLGKNVAETTQRTAGEPVRDTPVKDGERLTLPITKDGVIQWDRMRAGRKDEFLRMLEKNGITNKPAPAPAADNPLVNAALASTLYDVLGQLEAAIATRMFGCTIDQALAAFTYSAEEKAALAEPTARVINKYVPASLLEKYADEMTLLLLLGTSTRSKIGKLRESLGRHETAEAVKG